MAQYMSLENLQEYDGLIKDYIGTHSASNVKSAYEYAVEGGYTGTEEEFYADLAAMDSLADDLAAI